MPLIDENRHMTEVQLLALALRNGHAMASATIKHGPPRWRCIRCDEAVILADGEVLPSLIEDRCFGQPVVREEAVVDAVEPTLFSGDVVITREPIPEVVFSEPEDTTALVVEPLETPAPEPVKKAAPRKTAAKKPALPEV